MKPGCCAAFVVGLCLTVTATAPAFASEPLFEQPSTASTALAVEPAPAPYVSAAAAAAASATVADSTAIDAAAGEKPWYDSGYAWRGLPPVEPDKQGLERDTKYFLGYQLVIVGALYLMPESVTNWDKEDLQNGDLLDKWWDHVTHPHWDNDDAVLNYIAHPYWGATYFIRGRERGLEKRQAFLYSAFLSALYEYTLEAVAEPVSIQDLIFTPVLGSLVGNYWFEPLRERIRAKPGAVSRSDKTVLFLTDPLGVLGAWTERKLGVTSRISVQPMSVASAGRGCPSSNCELSPGDLAALRDAHPWGIQVEMAW